MLKIEEPKIIGVISDCDPRSAGVEFIKCNDGGKILIF
jgi:hypothetical protein